MPKAYVKCQSCEGYGFIERCPEGYYTLICNNCEGEGKLPSPPFKPDEGESEKILDNLIHFHDPPNRADADKIALLLGCMKLRPFQIIPILMEFREIFPQYDISFEDWGYGFWDVTIWERDDYDES